MEILTHVEVSIFYSLDSALEGHLSGPQFP